MRCQNLDAHENFIPKTETLPMMMMFFFEGEMFRFNDKPEFKNV